MDNEFLTMPLLQSQRCIESSQDTPNDADETIRLLQHKNNVLHEQIGRIKNSIQTKLPEKRSISRAKLMQGSPDRDKYQMELSNCYKKIAMYEHEISKLRQAQEGLTPKQKIIKSEAILTERRNLAFRLKNQFIQEKKTVIGLQKRLKGSLRKHQIEKDTKTLGQEIELLKVRIQEFQEKEKQKIIRLEKQTKSMKESEQQLLEMGLQQEELGQLRQLAIQDATYSNANNSHPASSFAAVQKQKNPHRGGNNKPQKTDKKNRGRESYMKALEEIVRLQMGQADYEKEDEAIQVEKQEMAKKLNHSKQRLSQSQQQLNNAEAQLVQLKGLMLPSSNRPLNPLRSMSMQSSNNKLLLRLRNSFSQASNLKRDEIGSHSEAGTRFSDRSLLGKSNTNSKITALIVYYNWKSNNIAGLQAIYDGTKKGGEHVRKENIVLYEEFRFVCNQNDYIKALKGTLNGNNRLESLDVLTADGIQKTFGQAKTSRKTFILNIEKREYPTCLYGSYIVLQDGGRQHSVLQQLGVEITTQAEVENGEMEMKNTEKRMNVGEREMDSVERQVENIEKKTESNEQENKAQVKE